MPRTGTGEETVSVANLKWGILRGLFLGSVYSAYVLLVYLIRGADAFSALGLTLGTLVAAYLGGGVVSGAVVGALRPLTKSHAGCIFVGTVAAVPTFLGVGLAMYGAFSQWTADDAGSVILAIAILGPLFGHQDAKLKHLGR